MRKKLTFAIGAGLHLLAQAQGPSAGPAKAGLADCEGPPCLSFARELEMPTQAVDRRPFSNEPVLRVNPEIPQSVVLSSGQEVSLTPLQGSQKSESPTTWVVRRTDGSVRRMLHRWATGAGWQLIWDAQRDFPVETEFQIDGSFHQAVGLVMESLATSDFPVQASLNSNLKIVRITKYLQGFSQ